MPSLIGLFALYKYMYGMTTVTCLIRTSLNRTLLSAFYFYRYMIAFSIRTTHINHPMSARSSVSWSTINSTHINTKFLT